MQRSMIGLLLLLPAGLNFGCGGSPAVSKFAAPPHGGNIVELPGGTGHVELKSEAEALPKGGRSTKLKSRIFAYFYQPDGTPGMKPAPTNVKLSLGSSGAGGIVNLVAQPTDPGQFASEPGDYPDALRGQIDFELDGKPVRPLLHFGE